MTFRFPLLWALLIGFAFATPALAQEPSLDHLAAARELVVATGASTSIDRIIPALTEQVRRQIVTRPELSKDLNEVLSGMAPELEQQRQQGLLVAARAYAKLLTEAEIKDCLTFFRSPSGIKYVKIQPVLTEEVVETVTAWSQLAGEYIINRARAEMTKRGHQMQ